MHEEKDFAPGPGDGAGFVPFRLFGRHCCGGGQDLCQRLFRHGGDGGLCGGRRLSPSGADLEAFFQGLESQAGLDFSNIVIDKYTGFSSSYYDSTVKGAAYSLDMDVLAGGQDLEIEIEIVKNDNGYGIYNLDVDL